MVRNSLPRKAPVDVTTRTANLTTPKILWNSVLSTARSKYICIDIKNSYLCAPMDGYDYMLMKLTYFLEHVQQQYNLRPHAKNGYVYLKIQRPIYGLPQAGKLPNKYLQDKLCPHGYYEVSHTPVLWKHISRPINFYLVVDDFGREICWQRQCLPPHRQLKKKTSPFQNTGQEDYTE